MQQLINIADIEKPLLPTTPTSQTSPELKDTSAGAPKNAWRKAAGIACKVVAISIGALVTLQNWDRVTLESDIADGYSDQSPLITHHLFGIAALPIRWEYYVQKIEKDPCDILVGWKIIPDPNGGHITTPSDLPIIGSRPLSIFNEAAWTLGDCDTDTFDRQLNGKSSQSEPQPSGRSQPLPKQNRLEICFGRC